MFSVGPSSRTRAVSREYKKYLAQSAGSDGCAFCSDDRVIVKETFKEFRVLENRFRYDVWDDHKVLEHLMLSPTRHVSVISELSETEKKEYVELLGQYESHGYSIYSRAPVDVTRSVDHLHTHLLKIGVEPAKAMFYLRKPHFITYFFGTRSK